MLKNIEKIENTNRANVEMDEIIRFVNHWIPTIEGESYENAWIKKAQMATIAVLITITVDKEYKEFKIYLMQDLIDFTDKYDTKEKIVEKVNELGYAKEYGYDISAILGNTEAGSNVYEIFKESIKEKRNHVKMFMNFLKNQ